MIPLSAEGTAYENLEKFMSKSKTVAQKTAQKTALPEELDGAELLPKEVREQMVKEYREKQAAQFAKRLEARAERFEKNLLDNASKDRELIIKRILLAKLKDEMVELRSSQKKIRADIKGIKEKARSSKKGRTTKAA